MRHEIKWDVRAVDPSGAVVEEKRGLVAAGVARFRKAHEDTGYAVEVDRHDPVKAKRPADTKGQEDAR